MKKRHFAIFQVSAGSVSAQQHEQDQAACARPVWVWIVVTRTSTLPSCIMVWYPVAPVAYQVILEPGSGSVSWVRAPPSASHKKKKRLTTSRPFVNFTSTVWKGSDRCIYCIVLVHCCCIVLVHCCITRQQVAVRHTIVATRAIRRHK